MNKNFVHQVGDQPRLYYDARPTNHQDLKNLSAFEIVIRLPCKDFCPVTQQFFALFVVRTGM